MQSGIISKTYGKFYNILVHGEKNKEIRSVLKGRLRIKNEKSPKKNKYSPIQIGKERHPLSIGDHVSFVYNSIDNQEVSITSLLKRQNALERCTSKERHCIGANLSCAIAVLSLISPVPRYTFLDRFLCASHLAKIPAYIVFSKLDLYSSTKSKKEKLDFPLKLYQSLGYPCFAFNLMDKSSILPLKTILKEGTSIFVGQSGVGKSTLLNALLEKEVQKTAPISLANKRGKHTTTNAGLFPLENKPCLLIDTPGLREWGLSHLSKEYIFNAFPETKIAKEKCKFSDCKHEKESQGCQVVSLLEDSRQAHKENTDISELYQGLLHPSRLRSLENILLDIDKNGYK